MSEHWLLNSFIFAELDWQTLQGSPGLGFHRLMARIGITTYGRPQDEAVVITNIKGDLYVRGKVNRECFLGHMRRQGPETPLETYPNTSKADVTLEAELDARRIEAIERIRLGGDLFFKLDLYGIAQRIRERSSQSVQKTLEYRANQSSWIEVLEHMGYRKTLLLEIPIPQGEVAPQWTEAAEHLQTAQMHLLSGHFRDAVGACRDIMESLSAALNDEGNQLPEVIKSWFQGTRSMGKEERLRLIRRALKVLTHPARHADEVAISIEWGPTDARAIVIMAATLLQMAVEDKELHR